MSALPNSDFNHRCKVGAHVLRLKGVSISRGFQPAFVED
jgi:hypothetical protein